MKTSSFKDLIVWQKSYELVMYIYNVSATFPQSELYGLAQQMRRSAVSIPSNIAEGYGRCHKNEYRQFLSIAKGSTCELETQYLLALDLNFLLKNLKVEGLINEVGRMLYRMIYPVR